MLQAYISTGLSQKNVPHLNQGYLKKTMHVIRRYGFGQGCGVGVGVGVGVGRSR